MRAKTRTTLVAVALAALALLSAGAAAAQASTIFFIRANDIWAANPDGSGQRQVTTDGGNGEPYVSVSAAKGSTPTLAYLRDNNTGSGDKQIFGTMNPDGTGSTVNPDNANMQPQASSQEGLTVSIDSAADKVAWSRSWFSCFNGCGYTYMAAYSEGINGTGQAHIGTYAAIDVTFGDPAGQTLLFDDLNNDYENLPASCSGNLNYMLVRQVPDTTSAGIGGTPSVYCVQHDDLKQPALRPDGQAIAAVQAAPNTPDQIVTIPIDGVATDTAGSPVSAMTPAGTSADRPDFSPDGAQIAFESASNTISTVPAAGGAVTQILTDATSPAWSPYTLPGSGTGGTGGTSGTGGTGGGGGTGGTAGATVIVSVPAQVDRVATNGRVWVRIGCGTSAPCRGTTTLIAKVRSGHGHRARKVGSARFSIPAGHTTKIRMRLSATGRRLLHARHGRLRVTLKLTYTSRGHTQTTARAITFKAT